MKKTKSETGEEIKKFFENINDKSPKEILKIKKLAMKQNIKLGKEKKKFCGKCYSPYDKDTRIRIKKDIKSVTCNKCGQVSRWKIKNN